MKPLTCFRIGFSLIFSLMLCFSAQTVDADVIRKPVYAGSFYPDKRTELTAMINRFTRRIKPDAVQLPSQMSLKALILPHAGYQYSGSTAAYASQVLKKYQFKKVVILAPDHRVGLAGGAVSDVVAYETPLGLIKLHNDAVKLRRKSNLFKSIAASDLYEHSLEVVLPFLQYYLKDFELVPVILGRVNIDTVTAEIEPLLDEDTLLVVSSDLSHYLPYSQAVTRDRETIEMILTLDNANLIARDNAACGKIPILIAMGLARRHGWQPLLLHYTNSGDTAGDRERVVGYAAIAFYGGSTMKSNNDSPQDLNAHQGQTLVKLARQTIAERLGATSADIDDVALEGVEFQARRGTFVTLTINGQLRGCIGSLEPSESILDGVRHNAVNAAFHDPRFPQLSTAELQQTDIEVSILTQPQPLKYKDADDLLSKLQPHVDGVILRKGPARATFLPQVWDQLPQPEKFLSHLCLKAGLSADTWQKGRLEILTYQVQYFEEEK
jgi:MEMO1 family protein